MPRPKGRKNKVNVIKEIGKQFKQLRITPEDLSRAFNNNKKPFLETDLVKLYEAEKPELEKIQESLSSKAGKKQESQDDKEREVIAEFAKRIEAKIGKANPVTSVLSNLKAKAKDKVLKF